MHSAGCSGNDGYTTAVADLHSKILDARPPPGVPILSISCSFWEKLAKSYVGAPPPGSWRPLLREILDPPLDRMKEFKWQGKVQGIINTRNHPRELNKNGKSEMGSIKLLSQTRSQKIYGYSLFSIPKFRLENDKKYI